MFQLAAGRGGDPGRKAKFKKPAHQNQRIYAEKEKERVRHGYTGLLGACTPRHYVQDFDLSVHRRRLHACDYETRGLVEQSFTWLDEQSFTCSRQALEQQSRQSAQQEAAERVSKRAQAFKKRKQHSTQMRKKTRSGQPVMKVRIGKMLEQLQDETC